MYAVKNKAKLVALTFCNINNQKLQAEKASIATWMRLRLSPICEEVLKLIRRDVPQ